MMPFRPYPPTERNIRLKQGMCQITHTRTLNRWKPVIQRSFLRISTADTSVPLAFSETLFEQIEQAGGVAELHVYPGADHNLAQPFSVAMQRTIEFFDLHLKGT